MSEFDKVVQATNMEATQCKYTLMKRNYLDDPYLDIFVNSGQTKHPGHSDPHNQSNQTKPFKSSIEHAKREFPKFLNIEGSMGEIIHKDAPQRYSSSRGNVTRDPNILEMNPLLLRGYWSRVWGIWQVVNHFIRIHCTDTYKEENKKECHKDSNEFRKAPQKDVNSTQPSMPTKIDSPSNPTLSTTGGINETSVVKANKIRCQVLNLGAGFDTMRWRLSNLPEGRYVKIVELDFDNVTEGKKNIILGNSMLQKAISPILEVYQHGLRTENYVLLPCDLRNIESFQSILKTHLDSLIPTVIVSEVALIYMEAKYSDALIKTCAQTFQTSRFVLYEQIKPFDSFGKVMVERLAERGCALMSIENYPSISSQEKRFQDLGYKVANGCDMVEVYNQCLDRVEKSRIERIHMFDEFEEWQLLQGHYIFLVAENDDLHQKYHEDKSTTKFPTSKLLHYFK